MISLVISGGQTGADQAGLRAARASGITTGGWIPRGWRTEAGPAPWLAEWGLQEHSSPEFPPRTYANAGMADVTLWFGAGDSPGYACTKKACGAHARPFFEVKAGMRPTEVAHHIAWNGFTSINVAGNRESSSPRIGSRVEGFLMRVFRILKEGQ